MRARLGASHVAIIGCGGLGSNAAGMLVRHDIYGHGRVTEVSGFGIIRKVKVRFSGMGEKTFVVSKAKLAIVGKK